MRSRWHDPALGTWLTRDPAGYADGMCLYRYVRGNPLVYFDPFGMQASWASSIGEIAGGLLDAAMELLGLGPPEAPATDANGEPAPPANAPPSGEKLAVEAIAEVAPAVGELMLATGAAAAGFIPGVGEVMDAGVLAAPDSTMLERGIAAGSLGMNAATAGVAPNVGLPARIVGRAGAKAAEASLDAARAGTRGGEAAANMQRNAAEGARRQAQRRAELADEFPNGRVQSENYLRDADGKMVRDPVTGEARRVDHAVIQDGKVTRMEEVTSPKANKTAQRDKENRIRDAGGQYIRDRETGKKLPVHDVPTRECRKP